MFFFLFSAQRTRIGLGHIAEVSATNFSLNVHLKQGYVLHYQSVKWFGYRSGRYSVGPDLGPDDKSRLSKEELIS